MPRTVLAASGLARVAVLCVGPGRAAVKVGTRLPNPNLGRGM